MVVKLGSPAAFHMMLVRHGGGTKFDNHGNPKKVSLNQDMDYLLGSVQTVGAQHLSTPTSSLRLRVEIISCTLILFLPKFLMTADWCGVSPPNLSQ